MLNVIVKAEQIEIASLYPPIVEPADTVIVIDVFRAFTTAAVALGNGAASIIMVDSVEIALALQNSIPGAMCMGERGGEKLPSFDFGNSPAEVAKNNLAGTTLIQTTSNGTRGIACCAQALRIYAASFVNAQATAECVRRNYSGGKIVIVAMGSNGVRTDEDELCALYLRAALLGIKPNKAAVRTYLLSLAHSINLIDGRGEQIATEDLNYCLDTDRFDFAVRVELVDDLLVASKELAINE